MQALILAGESMRCSDMFHASRFLSVEPFVYLECDGRRYLAVWSRDMERAKAESGADEVWDQEAVANVPELDEASPENGDAGPDSWLASWVAGAARRLGVTSATVPGWFPTASSEALRAAGVAVTVDAMVIKERRRKKSPSEVKAIEEALRVAEGALGLIRTRLREASVGPGGILQLGGGPLTSERLQNEVRALYALHRCEGNLPVIAGGPQAAEAMEFGHGPLRAGEPIVCDIWPRHTETRYHGDMTRVFCVGEPSPELVRAHRTVLEANRLARSLVRPGVSGDDLSTAVGRLFRENGYAGLLQTGEVLDADALLYEEGLGHGLGIDVHELWVWLAPGSSDPLREGDVFTVEPQLFRQGWGCVRLEDVVCVTADGCRTLSRFDYELI